MELPHNVDYSLEINSTSHRGQWDSHSCLEIWLSLLWGKTLLKGPVLMDFHCLLFRVARLCTLQPWYIHPWSQQMFKNDSILLCLHDFIAQSDNSHWNFTVIVTTQYTSVKKAIMWPGAQQSLSGKPQILEIRMSFLSVAPGLCLNTH